MPPLMLANLYLLSDKGSTGGPFTLHGGAEGQPPLGAGLTCLQQKLKTSRRLWQHGAAAVAKNIKCNTATQKRP